MTGPEDFDKSDKRGVAKYQDAAVLGQVPRPERTVRLPSELQDGLTSSSSDMSIQLRADKTQRNYYHLLRGTKTGQRWVHHAASLVGAMSKGSNAIKPRLCNVHDRRSWLLPPLTMS